MRESVVLLGGIIDISDFEFGHATIYMYYIPDCIYDGTEWI